MRYDTEVKFCSRTQGEYNNRTGNYSAGFTQETPLTASVTAMKEETQRVLFGALRPGACVVRIPAHYTRPFDYIEIAGKKYKAHGAHALRAIDVYFCSEMQ